MVGDSQRRIVRESAILEPFDLGQVRGYPEKSISILLGRNGNSDCNPIKGVQRRNEAEELERRAGRLAC